MDVLYLISWLRYWFIGMKININPIIFSVVHLLQKNFHEKTDPIEYSQDELFMSSTNFFSPRIQRIMQYLIEAPIPRVSNVQKNSKVEKIFNQKSKEFFICTFVDEYLFEF